MSLVDIICKNLHLIRHEDKTHLRDMPPSTLEIVSVTIARCRGSDSGRPGSSGHLPDHPVALWDPSSEGLATGIICAELSLVPLTPYKTLLEERTAAGT